MTPDERLMLVQQGAADPELAGCDVHRPVSVSAAEAMREAAAQECEQQARDFLDPAYAGTNPLNSFAERFACGRCAVAIRAMPPPPDPRDAEIARLRAAVIEMNDHIEKMQAQVRQYLVPDGDLPEHLINALIYLLDGPEQRMVQDTARAALAQSGDAK